MSLISQFLDLVYKQKCVVCYCSKTDALLCKNCLKSVQKMPAFAQKIIEGVQIFSATKYEDTIKKLIRNLKFNHRKSAAIPCAKLLFDYFQKLDLNLDKNNTIIVPVPSHKIRSMWRGYCHTTLIAKEFSKLTDISCDFKLVKKVKNTLPQYKVRANGKAKNVRGAFCVNSNKYKGETVVILDDLVTTGATLNEIINQLKKAGINNIICLTLACSNPCKTS